MKWLILLLFVMGFPFLTESFAQVTINVNSTAPCWQNYTQNGIEFWQNCGADEDYIQFALGPWEWVTGGLFSMIVVFILIFMTYIKYHTVIYPILIGVVFLPIASFLFPDQWISMAMVLMAIGIGAMIWYIIVRQTKEY